MNIKYIYINLFLIIFGKILLAEDKPVVVSIPDSLKTHIEKFEINVNPNSKINLSNKIGVKFTLIDSVEARFNHIVENNIKHYWQYVFNLRGGTIHIDYDDMEHRKKNVHIQSASSDLLIPKRKTKISLNRTGMHLSTEKNNREVSLTMDHNFDTISLHDSLKGTDLVVFSDVPVDPKLLSESLSEEMKIHMPEKKKPVVANLDSIKEEHCLRIVVLLNRNDNIADTIMNQCRLRMKNDSSKVNAKITSDLFLGHIEDMVVEKSKESLLPDEIFEKDNEYDSRIKDSVFVGTDLRDSLKTYESGTELPGGLIFIKGGEFEMGSDDNIGNLDEYPKHKVKVNDFFIDETEVTVAEYNKVMKISSAESDRCPNCPITNVNYYEAHHYCFNVGKRLPTEAEWEYAARAGTQTLFYTGNKLGPGDANFDSRRSYGTYGKPEFVQRPVVVMSFKPNYWGLFDMMGNVGEWCDDWYNKDYYAKSVNSTNPKGPETGKYKVVRGGTWTSPGVGLRSAKRYGYNPNIRMETIGFRCVKDIEAENSSKSTIEKVE